MSAPLVPSPLDYLGRRKFVLYPAVANAGPNEWLRGRSSWSETQLVNAVTGRELWIPWQYICGVSDRQGLDLVVELKEDLESRDGNAMPRVRRVITMPAGCEQRLIGKSRRRRGPASVVAIRTHEIEDTTLQKASRIVLLIAALCFLASIVIRMLRV
jgi:hypothetical protein